MHFDTISCYARCLFKPAVIPSDVRKMGVIAALPLLLSACGGGGSDDSEVSEPAPLLVSINAQDISAARFLQQAQFSSTLEEIDTVKKITPQKWLDNQVAMPIDNTMHNWLMNEYLTYYKDTDTIGSPRTDKSFKEQGIQFFYDALYQNLIIAKDTLRKRVALAFSEIFVVSTISINPAYKSLCFGNYFDMLCRNALGNFRDLLGAVTLSPAMALYLDTYNNPKKNPKTGRMPDENYAREVMQLFTIGTLQLNIDGTPKLDASGNYIETYNQNTVSELSRIFTGLAYNDGSNKPVYRATPEIYLFPMVVNPAVNDTEPKSIFGQVISATGLDAINQALDILFNHDNTPPFVCKQLIQRLVTSNPTPAYVARVATVFKDNGKGVRGDLASVVKAILFDTEATMPTTVSSQGKLREPNISYIQWLHTCSSKQSVSGRWFFYSTASDLSSLNQQFFSAVSVFNFFSPTYSPSDSFAQKAMVAPEMYLLHENSMSGYQNFVINLNNKGATYAGVTEVAKDFSQFLPYVDNNAKLVSVINLVFCAGRMSNNTQQLIISALQRINPKTTDWQNNKIALAISLTMISPDYRVQV